MNILFETPLPAIIVGSILTAILVAGWVQTSHNWLLPIAGAVVVIAGLLVWMEQSVETESEQVERTLHEIVAVVEAEDLEGLLSHLHPDAQEARSQARTEFPKYEFSTISVRPNLEITVVPGTPLKAKATFNVVADGGIRGMGMEDVTVRRFVEVTFLHEGDKWLVSDYAHYEPLHGMRDNYTDRY